MFLLLLGCPPTVEEEVPEVQCLTQTDRVVGGDELVYEVAWSPVDNLLFSGGLNSLRLLQVSEGLATVVQEESSVERFNSVFWTADGGFALVPTGDRIRVLQVDHEAPSFEEVLVLEGLENVQQRGVLSDDETRMLTCDDAGVVRLFEVSFEPVAITQLSEMAVHERCTRVAFSPSGKRGSSSGLEGRFPLYDLEGDELVLLDELQLPEEGGDLIWTEDEDRLLMGTFGTRNELYGVDVVDDQLSIVWTNLDHQSGVGFLELNGDVLTTGEHNHSIRMYRHGHPLVLLSELPFDGRGVHSARWSHDGRYMARTAALFEDHVDILEIGSCVD
jgi:WD40 repeat protein